MIPQKTTKGLILNLYYNMQNTTNAVYDVLISDIDIQHSINVRTDTKTANFKESLDELAESIEVNGLLQPIVLRGEPDNPPYDVVVGQRRFMACQKLGKLTIQATFTGLIDDTDAVILSLSENLLRREMNHMDIARAVTKLYEEFGKDERKVQKKLGLSIKAVRSYINIDAQATPKMKALIAQNKLSIVDAKRAIAAAQGDELKANAFVEKISEMTKYEKTRAVDFGKLHPTATIDEIIEKAQTPRIEETVILNLPYKISKALKLASQQLIRDSEDIVMDALTEWLTTNNYLLSTAV